MEGSWEGASMVQEKEEESKGDLIPQHSSEELSKPRGILDAASHQELPVEAGRGRSKIGGETTRERWRSIRETRGRHGSLLY